MVEAQTQPAAAPLLSIQGLRTYFHTDAGVARAVDGVSLDVQAGRTSALVGESGCGKSVTALSILGLIPRPPGRIEAGRIILDGTDLLALPEHELRKMRGNAVSMIFQEPMTSLNPVFRVGGQIAATLMLHREISRGDARDRAIAMLDRVGIPAPETRVDDYPHQMSGGMRQRVMIAMALACDPALLIADEPTTALDVTIQAQILDLLSELQAENGMSILLITHDLAVVAENAHDVSIMYAGKIVERADVARLFNAPAHPYTIGLFDSLPALDAPKGPLKSIKGQVPAATDFPDACRFHPRCPHVMDICRREEPGFQTVDDGHSAACWLIDGVDGNAATGGEQAT